MHFFLDLINGITKIFIFKDQQGSMFDTDFSSSSSVLQGLIPWIHPVFLYQHNQNHTAKGGGGRKQQLPILGTVPQSTPPPTPAPNPSLQFVAAHPLILRSGFQHALVSSRDPVNVCVCVCERMCVGMCVGVYIERMCASFQHLCLSVYIACKYVSLGRSTFTTSPPHPYTKPLTHTRNIAYTHTVTHIHTHMHIHHHASTTLDRWSLLAQIAPFW